jgi:3',5'-cyclic AMP phosphodiesterase CpdA
MKIAFITDLHFGRLTTGAVSALLADLRQQQPDLILIGGDVTQRGLTSQYQDCQKFLAALPAPWLCVCGNHDVPAWNLLQRFSVPYAPYQKFITHDMDPTWHNEIIAVMGLNSARRMMRQWAWEQGSIADWQIKMAQNFFSQHPDKVKILMVHHPLTHPPTAPTRMLVENHTVALESLAAAGIDIICTGHLHLASVQDASNHHKPLWMLQGGTATCDRLRGEANSYWLITLENKMPAFTLRQLTKTGFI